MQIQALLCVLLITYVSSTQLFHQPVATAPTEARSRLGVRAEEVLIFEETTSGVTAPRTFDAPTVSGFNFDSFAADDFINTEVWSIDQIDIKIAVNGLDNYDISRVYIAIYPDEGRGLPEYDPYNPQDPSPEWYAWYDWVSDDPEDAYPAPWLDNPVRAGAIIVDTTDLISVTPGHWWLTMHFEILTSEVSVPSAVWLPGATDLYLHKPSRLYIPGNNPSSESTNAFGWFWNDLENFGVGALAFSLEGRSTAFEIDFEDWPIRCPGESRVTTTATVSFPRGQDQDIAVEVIYPDELTLEIDYTVINASYPTTTITLKFLSAGERYPVTVNFVAAGGITWTEAHEITAVSANLFAPQLVVRDEYGLVGGLFQWTATSRPEFYEIEIAPEGDDFSDPEFHAWTSETFYRTTLGDWLEGGSVNNFEARDQQPYVMRIRATNPTCGTTPSEWVTLSFTSDSCEVFQVADFPGTYNFEKGRFNDEDVKHTIREYGIITDLRLRIQGFHQKWSDAAIAISTPVNYLGTNIDIPLFSDGCSTDFDSGDFDMRFVLDGSKEVDDICPPPQLGGFYNDSLVDPIGGGIFEDFVRGQEKRGTWTVEWLDRGVGFPTNGKIEGYDMVLCSIPVPPREHICASGECKIRRGTSGFYGP